MATSEKQVMVVGIDNSEHSFYALEWTLDHFSAPRLPFRFVIVLAQPSTSSVIGLAALGPVNAVPFVERDLKQTAERVTEKVNELCTTKSVNDAVVEVIEGDARHVLCEAVERHHATVLVVGSHSYGVIKRTFLGSVSDYCAHRAHCSVMIVKEPKTKPQKNI